MNRDERIAQLLLQIKQQIEEITASEASEFLTEEEIVVLATEITTSVPLNIVQYNSPIATVDRTQVSFMLDEFEIPIYGGNDDDI